MDSIIVWLDSMLKIVRSNGSVEKNPTAVGVGTIGSINRLVKIPKRVFAKGKTNLSGNEKRRSAPFDQLQISQQVQQISRPLYSTMSCFAALGLLFAIVCLILNLIYRKRK